VLNYVPVSTCMVGSCLLGEDLGDTYGGVSAWEIL